MSTEPVILLTGASRGLGLAIACHLLTHTTANLHLISRSAIPLVSPRISVSLLDLSLDTSAPLAIATCLSVWGRLDSLILNHGLLSPVTPLSFATASAWRAAFNTNLFSHVGLLAAALPSLRAAPNGRVVLVSSGAAVTGYPAWGAYGAAKAAMNHLVLTLEAEEPRLTAIAVRPGVVDTEMQREIREVHQAAMGAAGERFVDAHRDGKLLAPEVPGAVVARLAMGMGRELGGKFLSWNAEELREFQDDAVAA
ncbi:hypothetical protein BZA05DRAFT_446865 [Tricharina praecox]|uniref:uncharacterized protein n=1 Tax=Tricharina praecox TaxID=43433 RepID=UPI0022211F67|nr:uncharacterized protein BZA05DRAFT_446865 [Tricharina praecox]KAI5848158.1 hypothetical protein BZA05DRAFT_446865 [Tricharina praecox]